MNRSFVVAIALLAGVAGFYVRGWIGLDAAASDPHLDDPHDDHDEAEEEPHIALTLAAFETLGLRLAPVEAADFERTTTIPAEVAEYPSVSAYKLAAPVRGVVTAVAAEPGASVSPGDALFEVRITDERVLDAQLQLLEALTRLTIVDEELRRLAPLAASGAVAGRQRRDLEYERRGLDTSIQLRRDELVVRGIPEQQVARLVETRRLLRSVAVRVRDRSEAVAVAGTSGVRTVAWREEALGGDYSVERLLVQPGQTVERGEPLADLASHSKLYLRASAFERDVPLLARMAENGETLSAEFGHSLDSHGPTSRLVSRLRVRYVANHVDPRAKTYACYLPLPNEVLHEAVGPDGRRYRTWRFSVGQRAHLLLPTEQIPGQIPLPIDAVAVDGPNAFVFRRHEHHDDDHVADPQAEDDLANDDHEEDVHVELEPVPVTLLHRDARHAVVAVDGELSLGEEIAMNSAYQLLVALKADASGGGHGHHHHDH